MKIAWEPQNKQSLALARTEDEILYGGARGGGKTDAGQAFLLYDKDNPKYRALVIRKNATDLSDWIDRAKTMYKSSNAIFVGDSFRFPSGAIIRTGHLADTDAYTKYQGHEYQKILIEELSHIPRKADYKKLIGSCRSTVSGISPQVFCTTNPDEPGLDWIKEHWGIPDSPNFEKMYTRQEIVEFLNPTTLEMQKVLRRYVFIPAKVEDNPILIQKDPAYIGYLESLKKDDEELYDAWRNGNWRGYGIEGAYYRIQLELAEKAGRITTVPHNELAEVYTWCDIGVSDAFAVGYFQNIGQQWLIIDYDEFEGDSLNHIIGVMKAKPYRYAEHYAPHDIEVREMTTGDEKALSRKDVAEKLGINYRVIKRSGVADGISLVRMRFSQLWIDKDKCKLLLKALRNYQKEFDEKRGVFKDNPVHNFASHGADMLRYWAVTDIQSPDLYTAHRVLQNRARNVNYT